MKIKLLGTIAIPPYVGTSDDVINVPDDIADVLIKDGKAQEFIVPNKGNAEPEAEAEKPEGEQEGEPENGAPPPPVKLSEDEQVEGLSEIFDSQLKSASEPEAEAEKPEAPKKAKKG